MATNDENIIEDAEMADCDGEKIVTMEEVLREQQEYEEDANAVLGASDDKNCTYSKGYIKRQAVYACMTCCSGAKIDPEKRAGVCLACSLTCHENHDLVELYTKRNFRCDCGNPKFNSHPCQFTPNKTDLNEENKYDQNFSGLYCVCHRPYPDPDHEEEEMIQCIICEDWLHASHLEATVPSSDQYSEMICKECMEKNSFIHDYSEFAVNIEDGEINVTPSFTEDSVANGDISQEKNVNGNEEETTNVSVTNDTETKEDQKQNGEDTEIEKVESLAEENMESQKNDHESKITIKDITEQNATEDKSNETNINEKDTASTEISSEAIPEQSATEDTSNQTKIDEEGTENTSALSHTDGKPEEKDTALVEETNKLDVASENVEVDKVPELGSTVEESESKLETTEPMPQESETINEIKSSSESEATEPNAEEPKSETITEQIPQGPDSDMADLNEKDKEQSTEKENISPNEDLIPSVDNKRKLSAEDQEDLVMKKPKLDNPMCTRPKGIKKKFNGATFWQTSFRQQLCTCGECMTMYKDLAVLFLTDLEDTVSAYETLGKEKINGNHVSQYEKGLEALSSLDRIQQINALTEYNIMKDKLLDYLKDFKDRKEVVKEEDIKAFFAGMKPKREPDGVYFCR